MKHLCGDSSVVGFRLVTDTVPDVVLITSRIPGAQVSELVDRFFVDMVKYVVDVERGVIGRGESLP